MLRDDEIDEEIELDNLGPRLSDNELIKLFELRKSPVLRFYEYLGTTGAEWNYAVGVPLNYAMAFSQAIPPAAGLGITLGWNYLDAVYAIGLGTLQLQDEEDYRQAQNKVKGLLNIVSGVQMFLLSYNPPVAALMGLGGAALAAPSFALAMGCDLIIASIDFFNAHKEVKFEGWLEERAKEIAYDRARIEKFETKIIALEQKTDPRDKLEIKYLKAKIGKLETKIAKNADDIYARSRVHCIDSRHDIVEESIENKRKIKNILLKYDFVKDEKELDKKLDETVKDSDHKTEKRIQTQLTKNYKQNKINLALKTASFVGMTLLAVSGFVACPPVLIAGLAITAIVAAIYIYRNSDKILNSLSKFGLFEDKKGKPSKGFAEGEVKVFDNPLYYRRKPT
jgi:hypothetical protein